MKAGVVIFPGSNCDRDSHWALESTDGVETKFLWHNDYELDDIDLVVLPGGFSYGDYLRTGAFARFSPIMSAVADFAKKGGLVLGICNGFQILLEANLLPGTMLPNNSLRFICDWVDIRVENNDMPFTYGMKKGDILKIPIAHFEGNYFADDDEISEIENDDNVVFRYCNNRGEVNSESNPNGSVNNIAGIMNKRGNVLGMMPHPERASESILGSADGRKIFLSAINWIKNKKYGE